MQVRNKKRAVIWALLSFRDCSTHHREVRKIPRVTIKKKDYKILDLKGWVVQKMKMNGMNQNDIAKALGRSQPRISAMLKIPKRGEKINIDTFSYGDLLVLCELFNASDEEKQRLLTL